MDHTIDQSTMLDIGQILNILPHRYPFLLVDRVIEMDLNKGYILAQKNVSMNESFFQGHFPGSPILPGVLILEALAQAGAILVHSKSKENKLAVLLNVNHAKFRQPVKPGDVLLLRCQGLHFSSKGGKVKAEALVDSKVAAEGEIGFVFVDKSQI